MEGDLDHLSVSRGMILDLFQSAKVLLMMRFADRLGIKVRWVPFSGAGEVLAALAGGHVDFSVHAESSVTQLVRAGKIKVMAILSETRSQFYPNIPLPKDLGYDMN